MPQIRPHLEGRDGIGVAMTWRGSRGLLTALLVALPVVATVAWLFAVRWDTPSDGTVTGQDVPGNGQALRVDDVYAADSPLRVGDLVMAMDGVPLGVRARDGGPPPRIGDTLTYTVLRSTDGAGAAGGNVAPQQLDVRVTLERYPLARGLAAHPSIYPLVAVLLAVATFVLARRPRAPAARALYALGALLPLTASSFPLSLQVIEAIEGPRWPFVTSEVVNCLLWGALLHFALVFPDPIPFVARHRRWIPVAYVLPFVYYLAEIGLFLPPESEPMARLRLLLLVSQPVAPLQPLLVAAAMTASYLGAADDLARRRMRWAFVSVGVAAVPYVLLGQLSARLVGHPLVPWDDLVVLWAPFPVALGIAILRYRLFDIQVIVRRSLVLGALTVALAGLYVAVVTLASRVGGTPSNVAPFVASLMVGLLFGPLRSQVRRLVSRSLFGDRDDPYEVMNRLGQRLEATGSADTVLRTIVETLADTLRLSYAAIRLRGADERVVAYGTPTGQEVTVPIVHSGERVGDLEIDAGPHREPFGIADQRLLDGLARQVGVISQNLVLESRLRQSLERVVTAREEERRRLRRDLHDGLGPSLAGAALQVDLAASLVERDPLRAKEILTGLGASHREAVAGLRRLVDGLRPPVLDRLGLVRALRESAESFPAFTVTVEAPYDVEPLPAAVEVAAYRIVQEALANVAKHARAGRCEVRLWRDAGALLVQVLDDGRGLPTGYRAGVGLGAIRERATELGGSASITSGPGGGTLVFARLPVRPDASPGPLTPPSPSSR